MHSVLAAMLFAIIGIMVTLTGTHVNAETGDFIGAGIMLLARENGSTYILLGKDRRRAWYEILAGRRETLNDAGDNRAARQETAYETALRESFEESRGFLKPDWLSSITDPMDSLRDGSLVFFHAEIEKMPVADLLSSPLPRTANSLPFLEIGDYAWVSVEAVLSSQNDFVVDDAGRRIQVRKQLRSRLLQARAAGWL